MYKNVLLTTAAMAVIMLSGNALAAAESPDKFVEEQIQHVYEENEKIADVARESGPDRAASCTDAADCPGGSPAQGGTAARTPNDRVAETGYY